METHNNDSSSSNKNNNNNINNNSFQLFVPAFPTSSGAGAGAGAAVSNCHRHRPCHSVVSTKTMFFPVIKHRRHRPNNPAITTTPRPLPSTPLTVHSRPYRQVIHASSSTTPPPPSSPSSSDSVSIENENNSTSDPHSSTTTPTAQETDPQTARQFVDRLDRARARTRQLHTLLISRFVQCATDKANTMLSNSSTSSISISNYNNNNSNNNSSQTTKQQLQSSPTNATSSPSSSSTTTAPDGASIANLARRLRKDMRALRSTADDTLPADDIVWTSLARLQTLVEELELCADKETAYERDRLQEDLESSTPLIDDSNLDDNNTNTNMNESSIPFTTGLKRTVSGIEGRVAEFVRRDGSIDVDGLRGWARRLLDSITVIWMRLNGRVPPNSMSNNNIGTNASLTIISEQMRDEEREFQLREEIGELEKQLIESSKQRELSLRKEDQLGKLIRARQIRLMDDQVSSLRRTLAVRVLQLELERVFICIGDEIQHAEFDFVLDQRVLIFEYGDLDARLGTLDVFIEQNEPLLIDDDVLGELAADIQDMKTRLGLDLPLYSSATLSIDQMKQFLTSSSKKARDGFDFYSRGLRLFIGDVRFAWKLITRTVMTDYTPSAREVRTLRRTGRDLLTLVPFTIVLIAPLTPVGHVLIFSFLQRYWPEFFPSTFSERRQAMMKKRENYLAVLEANGQSEDDMDNDDSFNNNNSNSGGGGDGGDVGNNMFASVQRAFNSARNNGTGAKMNTSTDSSYQMKNNRNNANINSGNMGGIVEDGRTVDIEELTGNLRDMDDKARKERQRVALDELHLAD